MGAGGSWFYYDASFPSTIVANTLQPLQNNIFAMLALTLPVDNKFNPQILTFNSGTSFGSFAWTSSNWNCNDKCDAGRKFQGINVRYINNFPNNVHASFTSWIVNNNFYSCTRNKNIFANRRLNIIMGNSAVTGAAPSPRGISIGVGSSSGAYASYAVSDPSLYFRFNGMMSNFISLRTSRSILSCMMRNICNSQMPGKRAAEDLATQTAEFIGTTSRLNGAIYKERTTLDKFIENLQKRSSGNVPIETKG
jgi:hypothetical protein